MPTKHAITTTKGKDEFFKEWKAGELNIGRSQQKVPHSPEGQKQAVAIYLNQVDRAKKKRKKQHPKMDTATVLAIAKVCPDTATPAYSIGVAEVLRSDAKKRIKVRNPNVKGGFYYRMQEVSDNPESTTQSPRRATVKPRQSDRSGIGAGIVAAIAIGSVAAGAAGGAFAMHYLSEQGIKERVSRAQREADRRVEQEVKKVTNDLTRKRDEEVSNLKGEYEKKVEDAATQAKAEVEAEYRKRESQSEVDRRKEVESLTQQKTAAETTAQSLQKELEQRTQEIDRTRQEALSNLQRAEEEAKGRKLAEGNAQQLQQELESRQAEVEQERSRAQGYSQELKTLRSRQQELESTSQELNKQLQQKTGELDETRKRVTEQEQRIQELDQRSTELDRTATQLRTELDQRLTEIQQGRLVSQDQQKEIENLRVQSQDLEQTRSQLQEELKQRTSELQQTQQQSADRQKEVETLRTRQQELERTGKDLQRQLEERQGEIDNLRSTNEELQSQVGERDITIAGQKKEIGILRGQNTKNRNKLQDIRKQAEEYRVSLQELQDSFENQVSEREAQIRNRVNQEKLQEIEQERSRLRKEADAAVRKQAEDLRAEAIAEGAEQGQLIVNSKNGIAIGASVRRGFQFSPLGGDVSDLKQRVESGVKSIATEFRLKATQDLAPDLRDRLVEVRSMKMGTLRGAAEYSKKWQLTESTLITQSNRERGIQNEIDDIETKYTQAYTTALNEFMVESRGRGRYDPDLVQKLDRNFANLHNRMVQEINASIDAIKDAHPLNQEFMGRKRKDDSLNNLRSPAAQQMAKNSAYWQGFVVTLGRRSDSEDVKKKNELNQFVGSLIRNTLGSVYPTITGTPSATLEQNGSITGRFGERSGRVIEYRISPENQLSYKEIARRDSLYHQDSDKDRCKKGTPCGLACVERGSLCEATIGSPSARATLNLARKTLQDEKIPDNKEIAKLLGVFAKEFVSNPAKFIREGNQRENLVRESLRQTGVVVPTRASIASATLKDSNDSLKKYIKEHPEVVEDLIVNTAGFAASQVAGLPGDLGGALVARKAIEVAKAGRRAKSGLNDDEAYQKANALVKAKMLTKRTGEELKALKEEMDKNAVADVGGFVVGNAAATGLNQLSATAGIPLKGAAVAMPVVPEIVRGYERIKAGEDKKTVLKETTENIVNIPNRAIEAGWERERRFKEALSRRIKQFKANAVQRGVEYVKQKRQEGGTNNGNE